MEREFYTFCEYCKYLHLLFCTDLMKCFSILHDEREVPFLSLLRDSSPLSPVDTGVVVYF